MTDQEKRDEMAYNYRLKPADVAPGTMLEQSFRAGWNSALKHSPVVKELVEALEKIDKYTFRSAGPAGCDSHGVTHPCGKCAGFHNEKWIAKQALSAYKKETNGPD